MSLELPRSNRYAFVELGQPCFPSPRIASQLKCSLPQFRSPTPRVALLQPSMLSPPSPKLSMPAIRERPRGYQSEILERAKNNNIIAFLETGAGKTLVSALLVQDVLGQPSSQGKIAVFIVDKVALVHQQAEYMNEVCDFNVGTYYGDMGLDEWSSDRWLEEFSQKRILVLTAQIFLNALNHALIRMTSVAILVIDEAHHATREHPFRRIMMDFYHTLGNGEKRPRVFGMTASPVKVRAGTKSVDDCAEAIAMLEVTMDATIVGVSEESQEELESLVPTASEFVAEYSSVTVADDLQNEEDAKKEDELAMNSGLDALIPSLTSTVQFSDRGSAKGALKKCRFSLAKGSTKDMAMLLRKVHQALGRHVASFLLREISLTNASIRHKYNDYTRTQQLSEGPIISDRVRVLLDLLVNERKRWGCENMGKEDSFRSIVFVHQRLFAFAVAWLINSIIGKLNSVSFQARAVVGCHAKSSHLRMSQTQQNEVLNDFRNGKFGVLVATNVVEEGLDIPACSLVIAFDEVLSAKAYIQARGRARSPGSHYVALISRDISMHAEYMAKAYQGAQFMKATVKALNDRNSTVWRAKLAEEAQRMMDKDNQEVLISNTTPARVLPAFAIPLLQRYTWGLVDASPRLEPVYESRWTENGYVGIVTLPRQSPVRFVESKPQSNAQLAKRIAALTAYEKLYKAGEVDEYLLPKMRVERKTTGEPRRYRGTKGPKIPQKVRKCTVLHPKPLKRSTITHPGSDKEKVDPTIKSLHMYLVKLNRQPPPEAQPEKWSGPSMFGVLVENKILEEDLEAILCPTGAPLVTLQYLKRKMLTDEEQSSVHDYMILTEAVVRGHFPQWLYEIENKDIAGNYSSDIVDQEGEHTSPSDKNSESNSYEAEIETEHTVTEPTEVDEESIEKEKCKAKSQRRYEEKVRREMERKEQPPGFFFVPLRETDYGMNIDWRAISAASRFKIDCDAAVSTTSDWSYSFTVSSHETSGRIYFIGQELEGVGVDSDPAGLVSTRYSSICEYYQKRFNVDLKGEKDNLLEAFSVADLLIGDRKSPFVLCRKTCYHIPISPWAVYTTAQLPSWQTYLSLKEGWRRLCKDESLEFLSFARSVQPNMGMLPRTGPDLNYERNEFLGDAVLKLVSSMMAYANTPAGNEGLLTDHRDDEIANDNLCNIAVQYGVHNCIAFTGITRKAKKWHWFWGIPQIETQPFSEKVLADCIEALIGAHYLQGGLVSAVKFMDRLGVVVGAEVILQHRNYCNKSLSPADQQHRQERIKDKRIRKAEEVLRYKFKSKDIAIEALTHGSYASGKARSYQRLEFLGDAAVGFVLLARFFKENPSLTPGELSAIREPMLSNDVFARVVVTRGLHGLLWMDCVALENDIGKFVVALRKEKKGQDVCKTQTVPKVLGDILESLVGAIVVDQGMRLDGLEDVVVGLMQPMLEKYANPENIDQHPVSRLSQIVQSKYGVAPEFVFADTLKQKDKKNVQVSLKVSRGMLRRSTNSNENTSKCTAMINGKVLGTGEGPTKKVAKHMAAEDALNQFEDELGQSAKKSSPYFDI